MRAEMRGSLARTLVPLTPPFNRTLGRFRDVVWMVGDARSGSSWVANVITGTCAYRQLFEPFHPIEVRKFSGYELNHYQLPGSRNEDLRARLQDVFEGRVNNRRVNLDTDRFFYSGLLVKDVFATLFAAWASEHFPDTKLVLQVRNPFAVALSKSRKPHWRSTAGPCELLRQPALVKAHLEPHADFLRHVEARGDPILNHVAVWAILHHCLFRDFDARHLHIMLYRRMLRDPVREISGLLHYLGKADAAPEVSGELIERPARYSESSSVSAVRQSGDRNWLEGFTAEQVRWGHEILARFGLDDLYDKQGPVPEFEWIAASLWRPANRVGDH